MGLSFTNPSLPLCHIILMYNTLYFHKHKVQYLRNCKPHLDSWGLLSVLTLLFVFRGQICLLATFSWNLILPKSISNIYEIIKVAMKCATKWSRSVWCKPRVLLLYSSSYWIRFIKLSLPEGADIQGWKAKQLFYQKKKRNIHSPIKPRWNKNLFGCVVSLRHSSLRDLFEWTPEVGYVMALQLPLDAYQQKQLSVPPTVSQRSHLGVSQRDWVVHNRHLIPAQWG